MGASTDCIPNIGPRERRRRLRVGLASLVLGAVLTGALLVLDAAVAWRLTVFLPFWFAGIGIFQFRDRT